ncbi:MAG: hypothetical protein KDD53_09800, partial [Bdellovibrionales bacterium]|nr:hypothetical protein [Bdellovibrionales bacterium]
NAISLESYWMLSNPKSNLVLRDVGAPPIVEASYFRETELFSLDPLRGLERRTIEPTLASALSNRVLVDAMKMVCGGHFDTEAFCSGRLSRIREILPDGSGGDLLVVSHLGKILADGGIDIDRVQSDAALRSAASELLNSARQRLHAEGVFLGELELSELFASKGSRFFSVSGSKGELLGFSCLSTDVRHFHDRDLVESIPKESLPQGCAARGIIMVLDPKIRVEHRNIGFYQILHEIHKEEARESGCSHILIRLNPSNERAVTRALQAGFHRINAFVTIHDTKYQWAYCPVET